MKYLYFLVSLLLLSDALAQQLPMAVGPAATASANGFNWAWVIVPLLVIGVGAVAYLVYLRRKNPTAAAVLQTTAATDLSAVVKAVESAGVSMGGAIAAEIRKLVPGAPPSPAVPPGKLGQAGPLTIHCIGDPKTDQTTFSTAYFG